MEIFCTMNRVAGRIAQTSQASNNNRRICLGVMNCYIFWFRISVIYTRICRPKYIILCIHRPKKVLLNMICYIYIYIYIGQSVDLRTAAICTHFSPTLATLSPIVGDIFADFPPIPMICNAISLLFSYISEFVQLLQHLQLFQMAERYYRRLGQVEIGQFSARKPIFH